MEPATPRGRLGRQILTAVALLVALAIGVAWYVGYVNPRGARPVIVRTFNASSVPLSDVTVLSGRATLPIGTLAPGRGGDVTLHTFRGESGVCLLYVQNGTLRFAVVDTYVTHWTFGAVEAVVLDDGMLMANSITTSNVGGIAPDRRRVRASSVAAGRHPSCD